MGLLHHGFWIPGSGRIVGTSLKFLIWQLIRSFSLNSTKLALHVCLAYAVKHAILAIETDIFVSSEFFLIM